MKLSRYALIILSVALLPSLALAKHSQKHGSEGLADATVMIIRHAEKPDDGAGLTPAGEARARAYVSYFENFAVDGQSLRPNALMAATDSKESMRPRLTIEPLSQALGLPIDTQFADNRGKELVAALRTGAPGRHILVCWHHGSIPKLLHEFGANPHALLQDKKWPPDVYGWVVVLQFDHEGGLASAQVIPEHLMPDDK